MHGEKLKKKINPKLMNFIRRKDGSKCYDKGSLE